jgi:hypothetical protein
MDDLHKLIVPHVDIIEWVLSNCSMFCPFLSESGDINLDEITVFCCLNYIFECINGFSVLKNPWGTLIIQN